MLKSPPILFSDREKAHFFNIVKLNWFSTLFSPRSFQYDANFWKTQNTYFRIISMRFSSRAIIISPLLVSNLMKFSFPSSNALTHDSDLPINAVMYADTSSVCSVARLDFIGSPVESQIITPLTPSFSSKRRMIAFTSFTSIKVVYHLIF